MSHKTSSAGKVAGGLGLATLAAGAAAAYYLSGKDGKKHRKNLSVWAEKAKKELAKRVGEMEKLSRASYEQAAKEIMAKYKQIKNIDPEQLAALGNELKVHWNVISKHMIKPQKKAPKKAAKKKS